MDDRKIIEIVDTNGIKTEAELVTYLISEDKLKCYVVYTKGEVKGTAGDQIIYISRLFKDNENFKIQEISDDAEWSDVQKLLRRIANANQVVN